MNLFTLAIVFLSFGATEPSYTEYSGNESGEPLTAIECTELVQLMHYEGPNGYVMPVCVPYND